MAVDLNTVIKYANEYRFLRILPATNIDSLLAAGILSKNLREHGVEAPINLSPKIVIDVKDEPLLLLDLPKPSSSGDNVLSIKYTDESSITARLVHYIDKLFGITWYDKFLAIIAGIHRELDVGREGFQGYERDFLDELAKANYIGVDLGFRLWGWKKRSFHKALYRTLIPFIPGYSGDPHQAAENLKKILGIKELDRLMGDNVFAEHDLEKTKLFLEKFSETIEGVEQEVRRRILIKMLGYVYVVNLGNYVADVLEIFGALEVYESMAEENVNNIPLVSADYTILNQLIAMYTQIIDELSVEAATLIKQYLHTRIPVFEGLDTIKRPELLIDIIRSMELIPDKKCITIEVDGRYVTSISEYIRVNPEYDRAYNLCDESQICILDERNVLIKA
ncbi:MAG: hypothetical protein DRO13_04330 [Thermoprotei archaeon]|nr:MAG: hypothetical protein DRO13_04330 [Thermoprotei archaeon]